MDENRLAEVERLLQALVTAMGRDDVGVGEVSEANGLIRFTLTKGHFTHSGRSAYTSDGRWTAQ